jgi:hypothetical protein
VHLYPASLLITAAVLLPNLLFLVLPPMNARKYGKSSDSLALTIVERAGQVSCFILPLFFPLSFTGSLVIAAWVVMGVTLGFYYAGWTRFFVQGRDYSFLFKPMLQVPVPMAISPVIYFLFASLVLGSIYQAVAAAVLGVGHISISMHEYRRIKAAELFNRP